MKLENITKSFGDKKVLENFTIDFPPGTVSCVMGKSGCGKTTLLHIAAGLLKPEQGIIIDDIPSKTMVFQDDRLLPWYNILKNITIHGVSQEIGRHYLKAVGLAGQEDKKPGELSGGMKRRAAIARALAYGGDLYLLDEPCRGLDKETQKDIFSLLNKELQGKTGIIITHDQEEAKALSQWLVFTQGPPLKIVNTNTDCQSKGDN